MRIELLIQDNRLVVQLLDHNTILSESSIKLENLVAALPHYTAAPVIDGDIYMHATHKTSAQIITREENEARILAERKNVDIS